MFGRILSNSTSPSQYTPNPLIADIHGHILPGIDDGPADIEQSLELIVGLAEFGYTRLIATPHVYQDIYPNTPESIKRAFTELKTYVSERNIPIELSYSAEYFLDEHFNKLLTEGNLIPFPSNHILVEMSTLSPSPKYREYLFSLSTKGFLPILAHPERYVYFKGDLELYEQIKDSGCLFQVNILSFTGYYGKKVKNYAFKLLENNLIDFLGTDIHHTQHLKQVKNFFSNPKFAHILSEYSFLNASL